MKAELADIFLTYLKTPEEDRSPLPPKRLEIFQRVKSVISLMLEHKTDRDVVELHVSLQADRGSKISMAAAYRDLSIAKYIHGNMTEVNRQYERASLAEWQREQMKKAAEAKDQRGFNMGMKNLITLLQLDKEDPIPIDYDALKPTPVIFGFFPEVFTHNDLPESEEELLEKLEELRSPKKFQASDEFTDYEEIHPEGDTKSTP